MNSNAIIKIIKALGKEAIMEIVKSKWVQFCIGLAILFASSQGFIRALADAIK